MVCLETETAVHFRPLVARAFPLSGPEQHVGFLTWEGQDIGMLESLDELDADSKALLLETLSKRYFSPRVTAIHAIYRDHGNLVWRVDTDLGPREFFVQDFRENLLSLSGGNMYVTDVDGNRYDLGQMTHLDPKSRGILGQWI